MTVSRLHLLLCLVILGGTITGCSSCAGHFERRTSRIVLGEDRPPMYERDANNEPGDAIGLLERRAGDTLVCIGFWHRAVIGNSYFLIADSGREVFIRREYGLNDDDRLRVRLGNTFRVTRNEDAAAWGRARSYIARDTTTPIEIYTDDLLKTRAAVDSNSVAYTITRVVFPQEVEYQIICTSPKRNFNDRYAASVLAFYMVTGRYYSYEY